MNITDIINLLEKHKAQHIQCVDVSKISYLCNYMVICNGTSVRQVRAIAEYVYLATKKSDENILGVEGAKDSEWVLIDCGFVVVHCMTPDARKYYDLDGLWVDAENTSLVTVT